MQTEVAIDRLAMRARPEGNPIMHQRWEDLLFLHWPVSPELLRPLIPAPLEIDTFEDKAWIGITPFELTDLHITSMPPIPGLSSFHECNVRTYVHLAGTPGIWFFSLDASKLVPAIAARIFFMLPYFKAQIDFVRRTGEYAFALTRNGPPATEFRATWRAGLRLRDPDQDSLTFFLVERYCYFSIRDSVPYICRIYHHPWILDEAHLGACDSTMTSAAGIPEPSAQPLAHFSKSLNVDIWAPKPI
jgi:uncharacterized protein YqjF (DUF2071 family)